MLQNGPLAVAALFYCYFNHVLNATVVLLLFLLPLNAVGLLCNYCFADFNWLFKAGVMQHFTFFV